VILINEEMNLIKEEITIINNKCKELKKAFIRNNMEEDNHIKSLKQKEIKKVKAREIHL
jgi:hypothetical protein